MQDKRRFITLYYVSCFCLALALLFFVLFLLHKRVYVFLMLFVFLLLGYLILSRVCNRALRCEDDYTLIQAIYYYKSCKLAKYRGTLKKRDLEILASAADHCDFLENAEPQDLKNCFETGKQAAEVVTNPLVHFLWSLRDYYQTRRNK